jgi:ELWxxDGT repeat protein
MAGCGGGTSGGGSPSSSTYGISGTITDVDGAAESGVSVSLTGAAERAATTDPGGNYAFTGLANGDYTVTPTKSGYACSPLSRSVTVSGGDQAGVNFAAMAIGAGAGVMNGGLYFSNDGVDLWKTDGTAAGTVLVRHFTDEVEHLTAIDGLVYFDLEEGESNPNELWRTDGTADGTTLVTEIPESENGVSLLAWNGELYVTAQPSGENWRLRRRVWKTDGTAAGTILVSGSLLVSGAHVFPGQTDGPVFFFADDGEHGYELWRTDGTAASTVMVKDINPGVGSSPCYM